MLHLKCQSTRGKSVSEDLLVVNAKPVKKFSVLIFAVRVYFMRNCQRQYCLALNISFAEKLTVSSCYSLAISSSCAFYYCCYYSLILSCISFSFFADSSSRLAYSASYSFLRSFSSFSLFFKSSSLAAFSFSIFSWLSYSSNFCFSTILYCLTDSSCSNSYLLDL